MGTVQMRKSNRVITIDETQAKGYLARGYDQINKDGKVTKEATSGKVINPADHARLVKELETLKARQVAPTDINLQSSFEKLQADYDKLQKAHQAQSEGNDTVSQADYDELEVKAKDFAAKGKALKEENDKLKKQLNK